MTHIYFSMYLPDAYNTLQSLSNADSLNDEEAKKCLRGDIRQLFIDNDVHKLYGVTLLHKHFPIEKNQRLVEYNNSASVWNIEQNTDMVEMYSGKIVPRTLRWFKGTAVPCEFGFVVGKEQIYGGQQTFVQRFFDLLNAKGLTQVYGLRCLDSFDADLSMEVTEGRTNIMLPQGSIPLSETIEAMWTFGLYDEDRCNCKTVCFKLSTGHDQDHSCG